MGRIARHLRGGSDGNEQLVVIAGAALLVALAVEGATILHIRSLMTVHVFVGVLLIPIVALKLAATGWRALRYYRGDEEYVRRGPPHPFMRVLVAPVVALSTITLLATGVALMATGETQGPIVGLHKASFVVWLPAMSIHVLAHLRKLVSRLPRPLPGLGLRVAVVCAVVVAGVGAAVLTLPAANHLQDRVTAHVGFDSH